MNLTGITGNTILVREVKPGVTMDQLKEATKNNTLDEIVVQNDKGNKFIIFGDRLDVQGKFGLPSVGEQVHFGDLSGKVVLSNNEFPAVTDERSIGKIKTLCLKNDQELAKDAKDAAETAERVARIKEAAETARINAPIIAAEKKSDENANTVSIYGPEVTKEDAESWLKNNPDLARSPKLIKLADFKTIDGKVDADELAKISSGGAVVLNGPNSFHLPGMKKDEPQAAQAQVKVQVQAPPGAHTQPTRQPLSQQEQYYKRKNQEAAIDAAATVTKGVLDGLSGILR
jgi:hypothetical protein